MVLPSAGDVYITLKKQKQKRTTILLAYFLLNEGLPSTGSRDFIASAQGILCNNN
jgi:hypothetical protein